MNKLYRPYINREDGKSSKETQNLHHIMPTSRNGSEDYNNKIMLYQGVHDALHRLFGNGTPVEQITQLLFINGKSLTDDFKNDIVKILSEDCSDYYYKNGVLIPEHTIKVTKKK